MTQPQSPSNLSIQFGGYSTAGRKEANEDAFAVYQPDLSVTRYKGIGVCLADGVSCSENAQQASSTSVTHFLQDYYSTPDSWDVKSAAGKVLSSLNAWLFHHGQLAQARHNGLVTTFSSMILKSTTAHLFHVGDSRIYHWSDGQLEQVTRDHVQAGRQSILSRALGMDSHLEVDYSQRPLKQGDVFMLSTDGIHGFLSAQAIQDQLADITLESSREHIEAACQSLVKQSLEVGSDDNLTCLILCITQVPDKALDEATRSVTARVIPPVLEVGQTIDHFKVDTVLHSNSRSHLYKVINRHTGKPCVLKAPSVNFEDDAGYLESFAREQWIGCRLDHPNLMSMQPQQEDSPFMYHICEWIEGITLRQWIYDHPDADINSVRSLTGQIIDGLRALQRKGMVHRDIKPENILLTPDGIAKIIDYGTVSVRGLSELGGSEDTIPLGSVNYIAPEYVVDGIATSQSDLFSLAVMVYEMLSGKLPFQMEHVHRRGAKSVSEWIYSPLRQHRPDLPLWLDLTLEKAMHPRLTQRYPAFSEFRHDLYTPNEQLIALRTRQPLMHRNPLVFWKSVAAGLSMIVLIQGWWLVTH